MEVAVQLYTLRGLLDGPLAPVLEPLAALGVRDVEVAGLHGREPAEWRAALDAAGLRACARHVPLRELEGDASRALAGVHALRADTVVVPSVPAPDSPAEADDALERLAAAARLAADAGLGFAYHNHAFEFRPLSDGSDLWSRILAAGLAHEPDVGWLLAAGADPAAVLGKLAGRCPLVHAKDMRRTDAGAWHDVVIGEGEVEWPAVLAAAEQAGASRLVVELDNPSPRPLDDVARCVAALRARL